MAFSFYTLMGCSSSPEVPDPACLESHSRSVRLPGGTCSPLLHLIGVGKLLHSRIDTPLLVHPRRHYS
jgi:hypothetical protein